MIDPTACQRTRMSPRAAQSGWDAAILDPVNCSSDEMGDYILQECVNRWVGFGRRSPIELFQLGFFFFFSVDQCAEDII